MVTLRYQVAFVVLANSESLVISQNFIKMPRTVNSGFQLFKFCAFLHE